MTATKKLPATKSRAPKALGAVARQQLLLVNGLLDEVARNYVARLHREIAELIRILEKKQAEPALSRRELKGLHEILKQIAHLQINPEKGRRKDLKKIDVPTLIIHGDDDQIVPINAAGRASAKLIRNSKLVVYPEAPHGLTETHKDKFNADLLAFIQS